MVQNHMKERRSTGKTGKEAYLGICMRNINSARRLDLTLKDLDKRKIWLVDMACPLESNIQEKLREKRTKYQQLAFEIRERNPLSSVI